jgi:mannose-6-phosphate isomerase-like protein (cupin superfamily)
MPGARTILAALAFGLAVGVYLQAWVRWPTFVAVAVGAVMIVFILLVAASFGQDDAAADAAWRGAAPDIAGPWSNGPGDLYGAHDHDYDKVIVVAAGSIAFGLSEGRSVELATGDRLELPARTRHDARVGPGGVTCLEAHAPAGTLPGLVRLAAGTWPAVRETGEAGEA